MRRRPRRRPRSWRADTAAESPLPPNSAMMVKPPPWAGRCSDPPRIALPPGRSRSPAPESRDTKTTHRKVRARAKPTEHQGCDAASATAGRHCTPHGQIVGIRVKHGQFRGPQRPGNVDNVSPPEHSQPRKAGGQRTKTSGRHAPVVAPRKCQRPPAASAKSGTFSREWRDDWRGGGAIHPAATAQMAA